MAMYPPGQEELAAAKLTDFWMNAQDNTFFDWWTFGYLEGLLSRGGLYDNAPYLETLKKLASQYPEGFKRKIGVVMSDVNNGIITVVK
jgi:hypothetical protein